MSTDVVSCKLLASSLGAASKRAKRKITHQWVESLSSH